MPFFLPRSRLSIPLDLSYPSIRLGLDLHTLGCDARRDCHIAGYSTRLDESAERSTRAFGARRAICPLPCTNRLFRGKHESKTL